MNQLSARLTALSPSETLAMSQKSQELKAQGIDVINLSVGEPDFNTPNHIKEGGQKAQQGELREMGGLTDEFVGLSHNALLFLGGHFLKIAVEEADHLAGESLAQLSRFLAVRGGELEDHGHIGQDQHGQNGRHGDMPTAAGAGGGFGGAAFFLFRGHGDLSSFLG